ncbi:septal ring lytic transglycosylase RlpA family lipoprotein [Flavobacterium album]|uniref:Probable endolytic peptidoglycan transglycosylase RlpA n=1 Tax=Flavobacterium album TaxID=2175091 RepID=A0A2S1QV47_9FLAO|nr:septal ring lytic transglycosylase RlpA family protein [Flavobacterium album]AWH84290.1 septal ring lytic transglycosylase RlpA family lipoprotein [Flavobacterium album]
MVKKAVALLLFAIIALGCSSSKGAFTSYDKKAIACYYADKFNGKKTANGDTFSNSKYTAAHKKLAFGTKVKVTNLANGKSVIVTVNDRGPFSAGKDIDLTKKAFMEITDNKNHGEIKVSIEVAK